MAALLPKNYPTNRRVRGPAVKAPPVRRIYSPANDPLNRYQRPTKVLFQPPPRRGPFGKAPLPKVPLPTKLPPLVGPALKAARLLRWHPWFRIAFLAYDVWTLMNYWRDPFIGFMMTRYGFTLKCDSGGRPLAKRTWAPTDPGLACGTQFQVPNGNANVPFTTTARWVSFGRTQLSIRMRLDQQWVRPTNDTVTVPYENYFPAPAPSPGWFPVPPAIDPTYLPIGQPAPAPLPVPYPLLPILRPPTGPQGPTPSERPSRGNGQVRPRPRPTPGRFEQPATTIEHTPGGKPVVRPAPHQNRRPPVGTKERKQVVAIASSSPLGRIVSAITETNDLIEAVYDALPKKIRDRIKARTLQDKAMAIYRHLDNLNIGQVIANIASNQIEDKAFGRIGRINARESRRAGRPVGFQFGPAF